MAYTPRTFCHCTRIRLLDLRALDKGDPSKMKKALAFESAGGIAPEPFLANNNKADDHALSPRMIGL